MRRVELGARHFHVTCVCVACPAVSTRWPRAMSPAESSIEEVKAIARQTAGDNLGMP